MRQPIALWVVAAAALVCLVVPRLGAAQDADGPSAVTTDAGCLVQLDATPSTGVGCHVRYMEPDPDAGVPTEVIAAVACDETFEVCGQRVRCRCPDW